MKSIHNHRSYAGLAIGFVVVVLCALYFWSRTQNNAPIVGTVRYGYYPSGATFDNFVCVAEIFFLKDGSTMYRKGNERWKRVAIKDDDPLRRYAVSKCQENQTSQYTISLEKDPRDQHEELELLGRAQGEKNAFERSADFLGIMVTNMTHSTKR